VRRDLDVVDRFDDRLERDGRDGHGISSSGGSMPRLPRSRRAPQAAPSAPRRAWACGASEPAEQRAGRSVRVAEPGAACEPRSGSDRGTTVSRSPGCVPLAGLRRVGLWEDRDGSPAPGARSSRTCRTSKWLTT
jgi:hypothetical protein